MGYQFESEYYDRDILVENIESYLKSAVEKSNLVSTNPKITLEFQALAAGYGEHLFNDIARSIIASDIAIFETSDLNPNVMLEMGVALTWGVRVLPIKLEGQPKPPSDISGQTWAEYQDNGSSFIDPDHEQKLFRMVERAARKKISRI
jgi:putative NIF3 family GTP cyclohydrolase 1 type 2